MVKSPSFLFFQGCWSLPTFFMLLKYVIAPHSCIAWDLWQQHLQLLAQMEIHCQQRLQMIWWLSDIVKHECYFVLRILYSNHLISISRFSLCSPLYNEQELLNLEINGTIDCLLRWTWSYSCGNWFKVISSNALCWLDIELMLIIEIFLFTLRQSFRIL